MKRILLPVASHAAVLLVGFVLGIYLLPTLTAPQPPSLASIMAIAGSSELKGNFRRDFGGSNLPHWDEGEVSVGKQAIALMGKVAPRAWTSRSTPQYWSGLVWCETFSEFISAATYREDMPLVRCSRRFPGTDPPIPLAKVGYGCQVAAPPVRDGGLWLPANAYDS